jgi:hypothetical protein
MPRLVLLLIVGLEPNLVIHADSVNFGSDVDKWEIKTVTVIRRHDGGFAFSNMLEPAPYESRLTCKLCSVTAAHSSLPRPAR